MNYEKKYFYERSGWFYDEHVNLKYEEVLEMSFPDFEA